ncbi:hypothetical protein EDB82DRAFT_561800 [Fusarium venenatum]|uniref:uncharacterized protein n=1 Tax=Fusarium venenatum TaxID=56646 RepID=UPI001D8EC2A9|nr:hypothetical protein EDB82DRAFT_561800 [Fusarium venenatum]
MEKPGKKDRKGEKEPPTNVIDLSCSPASKSFMTTSSFPANAPKGPSREHSKAWRNKFTYNSQPLPIFSSNNPPDPPRAGVNVGPASLCSRTSNDTERSSYGTESKIKVLEICMSLKDRYLAVPNAPHADQEPFWGRLLEMLDLTPITKAKFKDWKEVHRAVEHWCQARRSYMRENRLRPYRSHNLNWRPS